jgi:hypothetical protein
LARIGPRRVRALASIEAEGEPATAAMDDLSDAERELIQLIRRQDLRDFTLTIAADGDLWQVRTDDHESTLSMFGSGDSFQRAWDAQTDQRLG